MNIANVPHPYLPPLQNHNAYKLGSDLIQLLAILQKPHVPWIVFLIINLSIVTKFRESPIQSKIVWKKKIKNVDDILYILPYYTTPPPSLHQNQTKIVKIKEKAEWLVPYFTCFILRLYDFTWIFKSRKRFEIISVKIDFFTEKYPHFYPTFFSIWFDVKYYFFSKENFCYLWAFCLYRLSLPNFFFCNTEK